MLKYQSMIEKLSLQQKIALLTDRSSLSDKELGHLGIPAVKTAELETLNAESGAYPSYASACRTWNKDLWGRMTEELAVNARGNGLNLLITPDLKCITNAYHKGLSEDAYLNGTFGGVTANAVVTAGAACAYSHLSVDRSDVEYLDLRENLLATHELFEKPFLYATEICAGNAILSSLSTAGAGYSETNATFFHDAVNGKLGEDLFVMSDTTPFSVDYHAFLSGSVNIGGAGLAMERAVGRYARFLRRQKEGLDVERELQGALNDGSAIDEATIDAAVDRLIDFMFRVGRIIPRTSGYIPAKEVGAQVARESIVLLKNESLLPLRANTKLAVIGPSYDGFAAQPSPFSVVGEAVGYDGTNPEGNESDFKDALIATKQADVIVLLLSENDTDRKTFRLSANKMALIDRLKRTGKRMIAVLLGDIPVDMSFDRQFSAVLVAPSEGYGRGKALMDVLSGAVNPSGKLTRTYYDDGDAYLQAIREDKDEGKTLVGPFVGYRYYDTAGGNVRYPFGFGLSYTRFSYSDLKINGKEVTFTVRNTGKCAGSEIAQVYVGSCGHFAMPKKQLKAFEKVTLRPGESQQITLTLSQSALASFDGKTCSESIEKGNYMVYVCASVEDIRLKGTLSLDGTPRSKHNERAEDYFRDLSGVGKKYRTSAAVGKSLPKKHRLLRGIVSILLIVCVLVAMRIGLSLLNTTSEQFTRLGILCLVFVGLSICFAAILIGEKKHRKDLLFAEEMRKSRRKFPDIDAEYISPDEVFDFAREREMNAAFVPAQSSDEPYYFDKDLTFEVMCGDLQKFASERGLSMEKSEVQNFLAAFATSQLLIVPGGMEKRVERLCRILSEYFDTDFYADEMEGISKQEELFHRWTKQERQVTEFYRALVTAEAEPSHLYLTLLRHSSVGSLEEVLSGVSFRPHPTEDEEAYAYSGEEGKRRIPSNLRMIVELGQGESLGQLPDSLAPYAAVLCPGFIECEPAPEKTRFKRFGNYQLKNLLRNIREKYPLEERLWKRVDALEQKIRETQDYRIGHGLWVRLENHTAVCMACGGAATDALDSAVADELLALVVPMLNSEDGVNACVSLLEEIFGGEEITLCRRFLAQIKEAENGNS